MPAFSWLFIPIISAVLAYDGGRYSACEKPAGWDALIAAYVDVFTSEACASSGIYHPAYPTGQVGRLKPRS